MKQVLAVMILSLFGAAFGAFIGSNLLGVIGLVIGALFFGFWVGYIVLGASSDPEPEPWKGHDNYLFSLDPRAQAGQGRPSCGLPPYRTKAYKELGEEI